MAFAHSLSIERKHEHTVVRELPRAALALRSRSSRMCGYSKAPRTYASGHAKHRTACEGFMDPTLDPSEWRCLPARP